MTPIHELKPCPFCGQEPCWNMGHHFVICIDDDCPAGFVMVEPEKWNTRKCIADAEAEAGKRALDFLRRKDYRPCDIAACNCGSWHGGKAEQRLTDIHEVLSDAGLKPHEKTAIVVIRELVAQLPGKAEE